MKIKKDNKLLLKILSALAAIALWFAITYTEDPIISQYLTDIDVVFEGEDTLRSNGLIVTNKDSLPSVSATIKGNRSSVISAINTITASVDVSGIKSAGTNSAEIKYNYPTSNIYLAKAKTHELTIETEKIISRDIPVKVIQQNADKNEKYVIKSTKQDEFVKVRGAESTVYSIAYAKAIIDVGNILKTGSQEYFYKFYDENDNIINSGNITYKSLETIGVENEIFVRTSLPVNVVLPENLKNDNILNIKNQSITSLEVGFSQNVDVWKNLYNNVVGLNAYFDEDKKQEDGTYLLEITAPDGCYVPEEYRTVIVNCELIPKVTKEVEVSVTIQNTPDGIKVKSVPEKLRVTVKGAEDKLSVSNVKATVDASEISEGETKTVTVKFETKENVEVIGSYHLNIISE